MKRILLNNPREISILENNTIKIFKEKDILIKSINSLKDLKSILECLTFKDKSEIYEINTKLGQVVYTDNLNYLFIDTNKCVDYEIDYDKSIVKLKIDFSQDYTKDIHIVEFIFENICVYKIKHLLYIEPVNDKGK